MNAIIKQPYNPISTNVSNPLFYGKASKEFQDCVASIVKLAGWRGRDLELETGMKVASKISQSPELFFFSYAQHFGMPRKQYQVAEMLKHGSGFCSHDLAHDM